MAAERLRMREAYLTAGAYHASIVEFGILKVFIDYKVFDYIPDEGDTTFAELATKTGGEEEIISRFATFLIAAEILQSPGPGRVAHTPKSHLYKSEETTAGLIVHVFNMLLRPVAQLPAFFAEHGLASPKNKKVTPLGRAFEHPDWDVYQILEADPELHSKFNKVLKSLGAMYSLKGVYDFSWLQKTLNDSRPAIVDVGGSSGLAMKDIIQNNEWLPAQKCCLFDLPPVVQQTESNLEANDTLKPVQFIGGSMFEKFPEAVRNSHVYQVRRVFNDFPDNEVLAALKRIREAAAPDSRLIIIEEMLNPDRHKFNVGMDLFLMCVGGKKRNAKMFSELADQAGFKFNGEYVDTSKDFDDYAVLEFVAV